MGTQAAFWAPFSVSWVYHRGLLYSDPEAELEQRETSLQASSQQGAHLARKGLSVHHSQVYTAASFGKSANVKSWPASCMATASNK